MKFEVLNDRDITVMNCSNILCFPTLEQINVMSNIGYKFKIDGKFIGKKKLIEMIRENS